MFLHLGDCVVVSMLWFGVNRRASVQGKYCLMYFCIGFRAPMEHGIVQNLALGYWTFHYAKRILETFFVHR